MVAQAAFTKVTPAQGNHCPQKLRESSVITEAKFTHLGEWFLEKVTSLGFAK